MADKTTEYTKYVASRQENLGKLVNALRADSKLLSAFDKRPEDVALKFGLSLARDEAQKVADIALAHPTAGELDGALLEAVSGGSNTEGCLNIYKCG